MVEHPLDITKAVDSSPSVSLDLRVLPAQGPPAQDVRRDMQDCAHIRRSVPAFLRNPESVEFGRRVLSVRLFKDYLDFASRAKLCIRSNADSSAIRCMSVPARCPSSSAHPPF